MLENPPDARAAGRRGAGDDQLFGRVRAAFAVDPQALLDIQCAFGGAELPQRAAIDAQQRAQLVGGQARRDIAAKVKAQREPLVALAPGARGGEQHVLAAQLAPVRRQDQQAAVDQPVAPCIAVMAHLDAAALRRLAPVELDLGHALAQRAVRQDCGRIGVGQDQRRMRRGGAQPARQIGGDRRAGQRRAAAIDDDALVAIGQFERQRRCAARLGHPRDRRRRRVGEQHDLVRDQPLITPVARLFQRPGAHPARRDDRLDMRRRCRAAALPAAHAAIAVRAARAAPAPRAPALPARTAATSIRRMS